MHAVGQYVPQQVEMGERQWDQTPSKPEQQQRTLPVQEQPHMYAFVPRDPGADGAILEGTFMIYDVPARLLFDTGATHSFGI